MTLKELDIKSFCTLDDTKVYFKNNKYEICTYLNSNNNKKCFVIVVNDLYTYYPYVHDNIVYHDVILLPIYIQKKLISLHNRGVLN